MYNEQEDFKTHREQVARMVSAVKPFLDFSGKTVLDVGAGQGMHAGFLQYLGAARVYETDVVDYESLYDGEFRKLLREKYKRNGFRLDLGRAAFITTSVSDLLFKDNFFDAAVSFDTFEHVADPRAALGEIIRCLKPGGTAFITFDPLYACDTGGHMFPFVPIPWAHLAHSPEEYVRLMRQGGAGESDVRDFLYSLNRMTLGQFRSIFTETERSGKAEILLREEWSSVSDPAHKDHPNYGELLKRFAEEDLLTRGMRALLRKPGRA